MTMRTPDSELVLGSRGSPLALVQARWVKAHLEFSDPNLKVRLEIIKTSGDADQTTRLDVFPVLGAFVKEIQAALLDGRIDAAVHSLKDVPEDQPDGLELVAFPEREDARDVFLSAGTRFRDLPPGSKVGTGSPRRVMQLKALRPDLEFFPIRGNVDTRMAKISSGEAAGVILAAAGLKRLGKASLITHGFSFSECIPAVGQAALALECRTEDERARACLSLLDDEATSEAVELERLFMKSVGGGCKVPMAAHAYPYGDGFRFLAAMGDAHSGRLVRIERVLDFENPESDVDEIADEILELCRSKGIPTPRDK